MPLSRLLTHVHHKAPATTVEVMHDQVTAMAIADRVVVVNNGRIWQVGARQQPYQSPNTKFLVGCANAPTNSEVAAREARPQPRHWAV
jgi:ABC-type sulfate/molybdate transport systems ATPase subunit